MQRLIKFSKFRNIGLEKDESLLLNGDFQKGKMGNLIVLIGPNNSGKSNVLNGIIKCCGDEKITKRDITNLSYEEKDLHPSVSLVYRDEKNTFEYKKELENNAGWKVTAGELTLDKPSNETIKKEIREINLICSQYGFRTNQLANLCNMIESKTKEDFDLYKESMSVLSGIYNNSRNRMYGYQNIWQTLKNHGLKIVSHFEQVNNGDDSFIKDHLTKKLGIKPKPNCITYVERQINNDDLSTHDVHNLQNSSFFKSLFKTMNVDTKVVHNAYSVFEQNGNIQCLHKMQKDIQKKLDKISAKFNELYFAKEDQYKFTIVFESGAVFFGMARGKEEEAIVLEYQSTGFRWFFNLFFNFLANNTLEAGDIVIMDEPATHLHVQGQKELRSFIKQFAIENDVLFVLATHSPFLIDVDHYDELRVVSMENNRSKIQNKFAAINLDDPDSLLPIKESLTIKQNVLYDLDTEVYFVEGITDYNYLTMFKKLLGVNNIAFLPFNGVGNNSAQTKKILGELLKVKFHKRSLLVDADKAGQDMFKQAKDSKFDVVHSMSEVKISDTKNAMMVEDLFSSEDKKKFSAITNKNSDGTSDMKDHCKLSDFSNSTINNFKQLFKILAD